MLERVRLVIEQRRKILLALILCFCFGLTMQGIGWVMVQNAQANVLKAESSISTVLKQLEALEIGFNEASKLHRVEYLKSFEITSLKNTLVSAQEKLESAKLEQNPDKKTKLASETLAIISRIPTEIKTRSEYLELLDRARQEFAMRVSELGEKIETNKAVVTSFVAQGFFERHFQPSESLRGEARLLFRRAEEMFPGGILTADTDYLGIFQIAEEGLGVVSEADRLAKRVPALLKENQDRIKTLTENLDRTKGLYHRAFAAAQHLERYAPYRCLANVNRANGLLTGLALRINEAVRRNDMTRQDFQGAADILNAVDSQIAETDHVFVSAVDRWRDVQDAIASLDRDKRAADDAIERADERIEDYDYNSQGYAEGLLRDARVDFREGDNLRENDPLRSRTSYVSAKSKADLAYDGVDTSSGRSSDDSIGIGLGNSNSGSDGGFFGSGGGGFDGPSGGDFGGPSGGDFGGPSGGDFGNGGF